VLNQNKSVVLDIDVQGVKQLQSMIASKGLSHLQLQKKPIYVFVIPPSLEALRARLLDRGTETEETIQKRLDAASKEMEWGTQPGHVDSVILNQNVDEAYQALCKAIFG
jgi:guanylate kinase